MQPLPFPLNSALWQLTLARLREFYRIPEAVFWVYGFPLIMTIVLGIAFRARTEETVVVDVQDGASAWGIHEILQGDSRVQAKLSSPTEARERLKQGDTNLVVEVQDDGKLVYHFDPNRPQAIAARNLADSVLVRSLNPGSVPTRDAVFEQPGSRYVDWLIPGLLGMNLMGGGLWGVGFVTVDLRVRKLLKRFLATPMRRSDFLLALMFSRLIFTVPEVLSLLLFAWLVFGVHVAGSLLLLVLVIVLGGACFAGVGLAVASRARTNEAVSGLMNLVMLPMWLLSGVFFSSRNFPAEAQPFIQALPLTALNDALRGVMLDGAGLDTIGGELLILAAWGTVCFALALRFFRWR